MRSRLIGLTVVLAVVLGAVYFLSGGPEVHTSQAQAEKQVKITDPKTGQEKILPAIEGGDPDNPMTGQQVDADPRTPVVQGGDDSNSWTELDKLLGKQASYTQCVDATIGTKWDPDVPKFKTTEAEDYETTVLLASNVNRDKFPDTAAIRKQAKADGIPNAENLEVIFADDGFVNTRGFEDGKPGCEEFHDSRSQIREGPAPVVYDANGKPKGVANDRGVFAGCHNPWYIPKKITPVKPTEPSFTTTTPPPGGQGDCEQGCVTTTPPPPPNCPPGSTEPECLESKKESDGAAARGNVPTQVQGTAPPATKEPRPSDPPPAYTPPPADPPPATTPRPEPPPPPPPDPEPTVPFDPCNPVTPACG